MLIRGSCHCGDLSFSLTWEPDPTEIQARACTCSFCSKHGGVWTSNPRGALRIRVLDPAGVSQYSFGTRSAQFQVCARCGAVPVVTARIDDKLHAVVNVNAFDGVEAALLRRMPVSFEEDTTETRIARWRRSWIADVRYVAHS